MSTSVSSISSLLQASNNNSTSSSTGGTSLDIDEFLQLLVAQMQNQDPLSGDSSGGSGGSSTDYISQLAQFTMLQQMSDLSSEFTASKAYSLIGKYVYLNDGTSSDTTVGKVDGVVQNDDKYYLVVGGKEYDLSEVTAVESDASDADSTILSSAELIGKQVTATVTDSSGNESTVTGIVDKVTINDGEAYVTINGQSIPLSCVTEISAAGSTQTDSTNDSTQSA